MCPSRALLRRAGITRPWCDSADLLERSRSDGLNRRGQTKRCSCRSESREPVDRLAPVRYEGNDDCVSRAIRPQRTAKFLLEVAQTISCADSQHGAGTPYEGRGMRVKVFNRQGQLVGPVETAAVAKTDAQ